MAYRICSYVWVRTCEIVASRVVSNIIRAVIVSKGNHRMSTSTEECTAAYFRPNDELICHSKTDAVALISLSTSIMRREISDT